MYGERLRRSTTMSLTRSAELPPLLAGIERVTTMKILGVTVTNMLSVAEHVQAIIRACAPSIQALRLLRCHGLNDAVLQTACRAIIVAELNSKLTQLTYHSDDRRRIEGFLRRGIRAGFYLTGWSTVENLVEDGDDDFFSRVLYNENHILHLLLPNETTTVMYCDANVMNVLLRATTTNAILYTDSYISIATNFSTFYCLIAFC